MLDIVITTAFGLETVVSRELKELGYARHSVENGRIILQGTSPDICRLNLWLRTAERVFIRVGSFPAHDFGELFDRTFELNWTDWFPQDARIDVRGKSVQSQLHSVPDCQAIVKKAIIEKMKKVFQMTWFSEKGPHFPLEISVVKDEVTLMLDTSGAGLHRRGYRTLVGQAPLRETVAAGLVLLSLWNSDRTLIDPFCGSGTITIEAALIGLNRAPGLGRSFVSEQWPLFSDHSWQQNRLMAKEQEKKLTSLKIIGHDSDPKELELARFHARQAGVDPHIHFQVQAVDRLKTSKKFGCIICNPPHGHRLGQIKTLGKLYREMQSAFGPLETWSIYVLTADPLFQKYYARVPDKRRKLYNGTIACTFFQFHGPPPPRKAGKKVI